MSAPTILLIVVLALVVVAWFSRRPMTKRVRKVAPGKFAMLSHGEVHYQWHGPEDGEVLILVHGLTTPSFYWRDLVPDLTAAGYRVLTFDHYGRGFSDRPSEKQDLMFFRQELDELTTALGIKNTFHLMGYSMGGGIVTDYAAQRRDRLRSLILVAPVGFLDGQGSWILRWPVLGDLVMFLAGGAMLRRGASKAGQKEKVDPYFIQLQQRETRFAGFTAAVLSSLRNAIFVDLAAEHETIRARGLPVLAIFAQDDDTIPIAGALKLREINRRAEIVEISGAGHALVSTHADEVGDAMTGFLKQVSQTR